MTGARVRWSRLGILLIVLLALGLRLYAVDRQDIWGDEAFSIWLSSQPLLQVVAGGADTHPPLYPFLLFLWLRMAGSSPFAVRSLSAVIGTLTVPVVYVLARRAFSPLTTAASRTGNAKSVPTGPTWAALLAALLAAVSPMLVYYSQETRMYGLVTLLAATSVYWAMRAIRQPGRWTWLAYGLATLGAAYTHYYAFFVILAENLVAIPYLLQRKCRALLGRWLLAQAVIALAYLPWVIVQIQFLSGKASTRFEEWALSTALRIASDTLTSFASGLAVPLTAAWMVAVLFGLAVVAGLLLVIRRRRFELWLLAAYFVLPLILAWTVNPIMPFFYARYLLLIAPAFYLLAALGVMAVGRLWRPLGVVGAAILLLASGYGLRGVYFDETYAKGRYGQMMAYVQDHARPGDGLLLANQLQRPIYEYYEPEGLEVEYFPRFDYPLEDPRTSLDLEQVASNHPRLWVVRFGDPVEYDPDGYLTRWLATRGSKAYFDGWVDADLALYVMTPAATGDAIQHPLRANLGNRIELLGYAVGSEQVVAGETLLLTLYWQAPSPVAERYTVFTHLLDEKQQIWAQMDSEPQGGGLPTDLWTADQLVQDNYALVVARDAVPGFYELEVGMYRLENLERLPVIDPSTGTVLGDRIILGSIEVVTP